MSDYRPAVILLGWMIEAPTGAPAFSTESFSPFKCVVYATEEAPFDAAEFVCPRVLAPGAVVSVFGGHELAEVAVGFEPVQCTSTLCVIGRPVEANRGIHVKLRRKGK